MRKMEYSVCHERGTKKKSESRTHGAFDIADPSSMQDACHNELSNYDLARHESPSSSVVRALDRCTEGHGFDSRWRLRFFLCPTLVTN